MDYAMCETEGCGDYSVGMTDFCQPCNRKNREPKLTYISVTHQPNGELVCITLGKHKISAIVNMKKWFMFRKINLVSALGLNYDYAREQILKHYKNYCKESGKC
ncbi:hypothetical protein COPG_00120 [Colwellia phage 9A]|uniref:Uncharacterized protein n=1 Tax=Colwellia phage 9A TaxID=765765 RepID=I3UMK1_9CAUD|nr:hypothetical protein COPG_00120 [Colwellia phage 9A]AFK66716.1 hypothetical protein COPG_00120 [Colwellia phage 9A]